MNQVLVADCPQTCANSKNSGTQCNPIGLGIALAAHKTLHVTGLIIDLAVGVVYPPVQEVEDIARNDGCKGHGSPVLTQSVYAETMRHQTRVHAEENTIGKARQSRHEDQEVRVLDRGSCDLCETKYDGRYKKTPKSRATKSGDQYIASNAGEEATGKGEK